MAATVDDDDLEWTATGFNLVARLGQFGGINGVYAIYNMVYYDETAGHSKAIAHGSWGIPPGRGKDNKPHDQFSLARIGDNLGVLGYAKPISWHDKIEHPVELVRVKRAGNVLGAIRQTIDERYVME
ncbi:hypothetical protein B0T25DRAFT_598083 [Lasiosphaeria hispida]|uniref:Uncharacterized protein n=1 Tax=Lasiosphaeria hispida TaxID=260671 RepID=A0AAJ0HX29_9PEZI|nr:hypothetical protein B0T25DRAFT_598083 [Lasiosphaeria hispida]